MSCAPTRAGGDRAGDRGSVRAPRGRGPAQSAQERAGQQGGRGGRGLCRSDPRGPSVGNRGPTAEAPALARALSAGSVRALTAPCTLLGPPAPGVRVPAPGAGVCGRGASGVHPRVRGGRSGATGPGPGNCSPDALITWSSRSPNREDFGGRSWASGQSL